mmetsp:Transcript_9138/g.27162  ORF Transcript_9138/g.27162 Transcript_9138/m.27162 type:complete len:286 (+) Transcript_9138:1648-2505(+)
MGNAISVPEGPKQCEVDADSCSSAVRVFSTAAEWMWSSFTMSIQGRFVFRVMADAGAVPTLRSRSVQVLICPSSRGPSSISMAGPSGGNRLMSFAVRQGMSHSIFNLRYIDSPLALFMMLVRVFFSRGPLMSNAWYSQTLSRSLQRIPSISRSPSMSGAMPRDRESSPPAGSSNACLVTTKKGLDRPDLLALTLGSVIRQNSGTVNCRSSAHAKVHSLWAAPSAVPVSFSLIASSVVHVFRFSAPEPSVILATSCISVISMAMFKGLVIETSQKMGSPRARIFGL